MTDAADFKDLTVYFGAVELSYVAGNSAASVTSYYLFGGQRVAMNKDGTLTYLHGDHLGSASLATDGSGAVLNEGAFKPFGEPLGSSTFANDKTYTGQRFDSATGGLMDYNARFYSPVLGRFVSADSIVPGAGNPQALNRYAYTLGNPLKYIDPDGHDIAILSGAGAPHKGIANQDMSRYVNLIASYKGWSIQDTENWLGKWNAFNDAGNMRQLSELEHDAGISFINYNSERANPITDADVEFVHSQLKGFQNITMIGYSKGAHMVQHYVSYKTQKGFKDGPDVTKFVFVKAPGASIEAVVGWHSASKPFNVTSFLRYIDSNNPKTNNKYVNIFGFPDLLGTQGILGGTQVTNLSDQTLSSTKYLFYHGFPASGEIWRNTFSALSVSSMNGGD